MPLLTTEVHLITPVKRHSTLGVVDTGAARTLMDEQTARSLLGVGYETLIAHATTKQFKTASNSICDGYLLPQVEVICQSLIHPMDLYVLPSLPCPLLLGLDFLATFELVINPAQRSVSHPSWPGPVQTKTTPFDKNMPPTQFLVLPAQFTMAAGKEYKVRLKEEWTLAPSSEVILEGQVMGLPSGFMNRELSQDSLFTPVIHNGHLPASVLVGHSVTRMKRASIPVRLANFSNEPVKLQGNLLIGTLTFQDVSSLMMGAEGNGPGQASPISEAEFLDKFVWPENLEVSELPKLKNLLWEWSDVFSHDSFDLGHFKDVLHEVHTSGPPIRQPIRRQSPQAREETFTLVKDMLDHGIVTPSTSPWASPVVLVKKADGKTRFCVDYRRLNDATYKDAYPLPRIDDTLDSLGGSRYFSTLDLTSGYWQIGLTHEAEEKSAFPTQFGLFQFTVLPFGMCNAPSTFQRAMECCLAGLQWEQCMVYLDDVIVFSQTFDLHLQRLTNVFGRFRSNGLKLKPSKCKFAQTKVKYLGHVVSGDGICPDPTKIDTVKNWPTPRSVKEVQSFVGLASYYRKFIKDFAHTAAPLHKLCSPKVKFQWSPAAQVAFETLKQHLISHPILIYPNFEKPFRLDVDACGVGLGAVLSQEVDGKEHVVAYSSRVLNDCETRYPITEKEGLALFSGVKSFKHYLHGRPFVLVSDHDPLKYLRTAKDFSDRIWRWVLFLERFEYSVQTRPGKKHVNADALSRLPGPKTKLPVEAYVLNESGLAASAEVDIMSTLPSSRLLGYQSADPSLVAIADVIQTKAEIDHPRYTEVVDAPLFRHYSRNKTLYSVEQDLVMFERRVVIPQPQIEGILQLCHDHALAGHLGVDRTTKLIARRFFWLGLTRDVRDYVQTCEPCQLRKRNYHKVHSPLQPFITTRLFQRFAMDVVTYPPAMGFSDVLVVIDYSTRWPEAFPMRNQTAATIARVLYQSIVCRYGVPEIIHSDRGAAFQSSLLAELYSLCGITRTRTTAYHPQGDGLVERQIQTLSDTLSKMGTKRTDWLENLPSALFALRVTPQASTGFSPYELLYGREPLLPADLQFGHLIGEPKFVYRSIADVQTGLRKLRQLAFDRLKQAGEKQKTWYDAQHGRVGDPFQVGDWVYKVVVPQGRHTKLDDRWDGPYEVVDRHQPGVWDVVRDGAKQTCAQDRLKLRWSRQDKAGLPKERPIQSPVAIPMEVSLPPVSDARASESGDDDYVDCVEEPVVAANTDQSLEEEETSLELEELGVNSSSVSSHRHSTPIGAKGPSIAIDVSSILGAESSGEENSSSETESLEEIALEEVLVPPSEDEDPNVTILTDSQVTSLASSPNTPAVVVLRKSKRYKVKPDYYRAEGGDPQRPKSNRECKRPEWLGVDATESREVRYREESSEEEM